MLTLRLSAVLACALFVQALHSDNSLADHPWQGSGWYGNVNYVYHEFYPGGSGRITYRLCNAGVGGQVPPTWAEGVENWDNSLGPSFEFDPVTSCNAATKVELKWTTTQECGAGKLGLLVNPNQYRVLHPAWIT